jgi:hypothetical protein
VRTQNPDSEPAKLDISPSMPDIRTRPASGRSQSQTHLLAFFKDLLSFTGSGIISYRYAIVVFRHPDGAIMSFITLENSATMSNALCYFDKRCDTQVHHNLGTLNTPNLLQAFLEESTIILEQKFGISGVNWEWVSNPGFDA